MSKKASVSNGDRSKTGNPDFRGFVNYSLTESDKATASDWIADLDFENILAKLFDHADRYKLSVSPDKDYGRYIASLSCKAGENAGFVLSARANSPFQAIGRALFLHVVVFDGQAWSDREVDDNAW